MGLLEIPLIARTRQNHALEHATIHVLSQRLPTLGLFGRSDPGGFTIYGDVTVEALQDATETALRRMRQGESDLAVHPFCGTNLVTASLLAGFSAIATAQIGQRRSWWDRIPFSIAGAMLAIYMAYPLGFLAQKHVTTLADMRDMEIASITPVNGGRFSGHRVETVRKR